MTRALARRRHGAPTLTQPLSAKAHDSDSQSTLVAAVQVAVRAASCWVTCGSWRPSRRGVR